jgi:hypothetical protein
MVTPTMEHGSVFVISLECRVMECGSFTPLYPISTSNKHLLSVSYYAIVKQFGLRVTFVNFMWRRNPLVPTEKENRCAT